MARRRTVHGDQAKLGKTGKVWEKTASDEVRAVPEGAAEPEPPGDKGRFDTDRARWAARRRWLLAAMPDFEQSTAPWFPPLEKLARFDTARQDALLQRWDEINAMTGAVSSGVGVKIRAYSYLAAAGEFYGATFFATGERDAFECMTRAFKAMATMDDDVRDTAAWEADARSKATPANPSEALARALAAEHAERERKRLAAKENTK